jgi:hypothetical protein
LKRREVLKWGAAFAVLDMAGAARAQDVTAWTAKPVRLILPFTPGWRIVNISTLEQRSPPFVAPRPPSP